MAEAFCAEVARAGGASLAGTASRAEAFLLIEHRGDWGAQAVEENDLPPPVQSWLQAELAALREVVGKPRALLVRREGGDGAELACFLAVTQEARQELYRFTLASHDELPALALARGLAEGALARHRSSERLTLMCGNARRDRCCARYGVPTYRELARVEPATTWLSTHQGGHRYAGSGLWLPEGVAHGFLQPEQADALRAARARDAVHLPCFRGRTFHAPVVQAADAFLRTETGVHGLDAWRLAGAVEEAPGTWRVAWSGLAGRFAVRLAAGSERALVSCTPAKEKTIDHFTLLAVEREDDAA